MDIDRILQSDQGYYIIRNEIAGEIAKQIREKDQLPEGHIVKCFNNPKNTCIPEIIIVKESQDQRRKYRTLEFLIGLNTQRMEIEVSLKRSDTPDQRRLEKYDLRDPNCYFQASQKIAIEGPAILDNIW